MFGTAPDAGPGPESRWPDPAARRRAAIYVVLFCAVVWCLIIWLAV
jgi:hypothetical protein